MTNRIVDAARGFVGVPYHHQGRNRFGLDCVGLVIAVARELALVPDYFDITGYGRVPDGASLMKHLTENLEPVEQADMRTGDVVCVAFQQWPQHVGIVGDYVHGGHSIIHADIARGRVLETRLMFSASMRFVAAFRFHEEVA